MNLMELWVGGYGPEDSSHGRGLATFRAVMEDLTAGAVTVRVTWNIMEDGRPNTDLLDLVESGDMFFCYFSSSYLGGRVAALDVLETPYLFEDLDHAHRALDGELGEKLNDAVRDATGFEVLGFWDNGFRHFTNALRPVATPDDCRGMRVRTQPNAIHEELFRGWGATPVPVELSEAIRLITSRRVDAQENPLANTVAYGIDQVHPFVTMTGHLYGARGLWANRSILESMSDELRLAVEQATRSAIEVQRREGAAAEATLRARLEESGVKFVDLDEKGRAAFANASLPAIELAGAGPAGNLVELALA